MYDRVNGSTIFLLWLFGPIVVPFLGALIILAPGVGVGVALHAVYDIDELTYPLRLIDEYIGFPVPIGAEGALILLSFAVSLICIHAITDLKNLLPGSFLARAAMALAVLTNNHGYGIPGSGFFLTRWMLWFVGVLPALLGMVILHSLTNNGFYSYNISPNSGILMVFPLLSEIISEFFTGHTDGYILIGSFYFLVIRAIVGKRSPIKDHSI